MLKELVVTALLSGSIGLKSNVPVTTPFHETPYVADVDYSNSVTSVYGVYNFRNVWSFDVENSFSGEIVFETPGDGSTTPLYKYLCPFAFGDNTYQQLYLLSIEYHYYVLSGTNSFGYLDLTFNCYDLWANSFDTPMTIEHGEDLTDFPTTFQGMMFYVRDTNIILHGVQSYLFDSLFTLEDNAYTYSYSGYYSFTNNITQINNKVVAFGNCIFNNNVSYGFTNFGYTSNVIGYYEYNVLDTVYYVNLYNLPFNKNVVMATNMLCSNIKMTNQTHTFLQSVGVFQYVRDTSYDDTDFKDLVFTLMDSPIYMMSRLLNFELFGINLFIALAGFLTIIVVIFLIRKFL